MSFFKHSRFNKLQRNVLIISILIAVGIERLKLTDVIVKSIPNETLSFAISVLITVAVALFGYNLIIAIVLWLINHSKVCLRLYWGKLYLAGYWYYEYVELKKNVENQDPKYGIWCIEQTVYGTHISGFGLFGNGTLEQPFKKYRTTVQSKTELIENEHCFEVILSKIAAENPSVKYFAKASISIDNNENYKWFPFISKMTKHFHSYTYTYGGSKDVDEKEKAEDDIHIDMYHKLPSKNEDNAVVFLTNKLAERRGKSSEHDDTGNIIFHRKITLTKRNIQFPFRLKVGKN